MSKVACPLLKQKFPRKQPTAPMLGVKLMFNIVTVKLKKQLNFVKGFPIRRPKPMFTK